MFIVDCLPLSKGLNKDMLSYFSATDLEPGSLISVTLRSRNVNALVLGVRSVREAKAEIKAADFQLKKVESFKSKPFLQKEFLESVIECSDYFASSPGSILSHLLPAFILENPNLLSKNKKNLLAQTGKVEKTPQEIFEKDLGFNTFVLQAGEQERFAHYRSLIREEFAKKRSVFLCLPQNEDIKEAKNILERGIEPYVATFHKDLNKKEWRDEWKKANLQTHPVLIIATARMLFIPRSDLGVILIDKENENGWKTISRPFIDLRFFAETLGKHKDIRAILSDSFLRIETLHRVKQKEIGEFERTEWRLPQNISGEIIDLRETAKQEKARLNDGVGQEYRAVSKEMLKLIEETIKKGQRMFLFAARKGLSSVVVCNDCGNQVKCLNCSSPMVLHSSKSGNIFKCHQCGETRDAAEYCGLCGSWKLGAYGSGIDRIKEEIKKNFPAISLFEIHKEITTTSAKAELTIKKFFETEGAVLLGTEMAFSYIHKKITHTGIASFDSLFSIPDFRIREKIFRIILQTRSLAKERFLIQTRNPEDPTLGWALDGDLQEFYKKELDDRRILGYPPYGTFIKITARGTKIAVSKEEANLKNLFAQENYSEYNPAIFYSIHEKKGEQAAINAVIKIPKEDWPDPTLLSLLKSLPPSYEIKVDPDNLL